ncbi:MAG: ADP-ribosylglycohydrolase family protein [Clostridia bacterium]|nr:ADP-ribosylglycohydrolase family protein [Clostridia bacterium]
MKLDFKNYKDKVKACWLGKNIGGTMGTPYECMREVLDIKGFKTAPNVVLPNDDLDLQLVWLYALEQLGAHAINANILGEFWHSLITPHWNEYGIGKANMRRGLIPPLSGDYDNDWRNSNGAWIRTEIWACVAPAMPVIAAKYAIEDAKVDHGAGEGTFAAAFVAAMQSSAFAIQDLNSCIEIGLSAIPEKSRVARTVRLVLDCYNKGMDWLEARNRVLEENMDIGNGWFEAPSNIGYTVIGLIYGEGDFKKSMITAINCGDDTDCTGATVGATLGILYGMEGLPKDWCDHIGDSIVTVSISKGGQGGLFPKTCSELTERVVSLAPSVLYAHNKSVEYAHQVWTDKIYDSNGREHSVEFSDVNEIPEDIEDLLKRRVKLLLLPETERLKPYSMHFESAFIRADVTLGGVPEIKPSGEISAHIKFSNVRAFENQQHPLSLRWILPEGFSAQGKRSALLMDYNAHSIGETSVDAAIKAGDIVSGDNRIILEVTVPGRHTALYISFVLFGC